MSSIEPLAHELVTYLQKGQFEAAQREFFAADARSIEPAHTGQPVAEGLEAILARGAAFRAAVQQFHQLQVSIPVISARHFSLVLRVELTFKGQDQPVWMDEIIVYEVADGKIVSEQFFY